MPSFALGEDEDKYVRFDTRASLNSNASDEGGGLRDSMTALDKHRQEGRRSTFSSKAFMPERTDQEITNRYDIDSRESASGGYGKVFMAKDKRGGDKTVAIKRVPKVGLSDAKKKEAFYREVSIMKELDHPNICKLLETYENQRFMYFVMECCSGGEVFDRIMELEMISEPNTARIIKQVASALRYAHSKGIAHRDLKPENICFCDTAGDQVKVIDWGLGFYFGQARMSSAVGSSSYAAPEVLQAKRGASYSPACDLWSLGVLTYVMLSGKPPFWGSHSEQLARMNAERYPIQGSPWNNLSKSCLDFIKNLLRKDPNNRMTIDKVLAHEWFTINSEESLQADEQREVLKNMQQFKNTSVFFSLCVASIARQLDHSSLKSVHKVFADMDTNGDGVLELHEVKEGFEKLFGKDSPEAQQVEEMFAKLDLDGSGTLDYTEFCAAGIGEQMTSQEHLLWAAFKTFDADDNGTVSVEEIKQVLLSSSVQNAWSKEVCDQVSQEVMQKFDADGNGHIDFEEWLAMMQSSQVSCTEHGKKTEPSSSSTTSQDCQDEDHLLAQIETYMQQGRSEEAYELIRRLNEQKRKLRESGSMSMSEASSPNTKVARTSAKDGSIVARMTTSLARTITGGTGQTPVCDGVKCTMM